MWTLKKLIVSEWIKTFITSVLVLFILVSIADLISGLLRSSVTPIEVLQNYVLKQPDMFSKILPLSCLVASLFSVNKLISRNELMAIFSIGFSRRMYIFVIFQISLVVAFLQFFNLSIMAPMSKEARKYLSPESTRKFKNNRSMGLLTTAIGGGKIWYKGPNYFVSFKAFDKDNDTLKDVSLFYMNKNGNASSIVKSPHIKYKDNNIWKFHDGNEMNLLDEKVYPVLNQFENKSIRLNEEANDFLKIQTDVTTLGFLGLYSFIQQIRSTGINTSEYEMLFYDKISSSLMCIIFAIFALNAIFSPNRRSSSFGKSVLFTFVFTILYWLVHSSIVALGNSGRLPALVASFAIPFLFLTYFLVFFYKKRKL